MNRKYFIETYGCQMNTAESGALEEKLKSAGWEPSETGKDAELIILNTCSVRTTAENRIWGRLGFYKTEKKKRHFKLGVMGCMTERLGNEIRKEVPEIDYLIGTFGKEDFVNSLLNIDKDREENNFFGESEYKFALEHSGEGSFQAMVPIMHGCDNFCSYCIVPYVRGRETSRNPYEIVNELKKLQEREIQEVTLLGQNVNSYRYKSEETDNIIDFPGLLEIILKETNIPWLRFISSHPKDMDDKLIRIISENKRMCRHIHLPVQNGSSKILDRMNRRYTREDYLGLVKKMRDNIPGLSLTTDIMVGFPGEDENDYLQTLELVKSIKFDDAFTYQYNPIEKTAASSFEDQVDDKVKKRRLAELIDLQRSISSEIKRKLVGDSFDVLVEGVSKKSKEELLGRTERNHMVVFKGNENLTGKICRVKLISLSGNTFKGELICPGD